MDHKKENLNKKVILVVEDERPLAEAVRVKLEHSGFEVAVSRTVNQAQGYLEDLTRVDAIWLDHYLLGKEDGLDFMAYIKGRNSKWGQIPVFVVSNTAGTEKVQSYLRLGIEKYYIKAEHRLEDIIKDIKEVLNNEDNSL